VPDAGSPGIRAGRSTPWSRRRRMSSPDLRRRRRRDLLRRGDARPSGPHERESDALDKQRRSSSFVVGHVRLSRSRTAASESPLPDRLAVPAASASTTALPREGGRGNALVDVIALSCAELDNRGDQPAAGERRRRFEPAGGPGQTVPRVPALARAGEGASRLRTTRGSDVSDAADQRDVKHRVKSPFQVTEPLRVIACRPGTVLSARTHSEECSRGHFQLREDYC
jgi:hypothetical protein